MARAILVLASALLFTSLAAQAADVVKVKGKGVLVNLSGETAQVGDNYYLLNSSGKKIGIIRIVKMIKGDQAIAKLTAGQANPGMILQKRAAGGGTTARRREKGGGGSAYLQSKSYWGVLGGFSKNSMSVDLTNGANASMSGTGFSVFGMFDYMFFDRVWFRGSAGYEAFNVSGGNACSGTCDAQIGYLAFSFMGRYLFTDGSIRPWLGGGFDLLFPATKSSTALESSSVTNAGIFIFAAGADWSISNTMYIPFSVEYGLFPKSASVEASWIAVRAGIAVPF
jgi:outer membrane protein W